MIATTPVRSRPGGLDARAFAVSLALVPALLSGIGAPRRAEVAVRNAIIHTASHHPPRAEAMAIEGGRIVVIGTNREVDRWIGPDTEVIDAEGATVLPGLIDSHGHVDNLGRMLENVDVTGTTSYAAVIEKLAERARTLPEGRWVEGRGWDQNDWADKALPTHGPLSAAIPDRPVIVERVDGHAVLANARALALANIGQDTPDPPGGRIERDAAGEATGVLVDNATTLVESLVPPPTAGDREQRLLAALHECARHGLTMVHDAGIDAPTLEAYRALLQRREFPIRIYAMVDADDSTLLEERFEQGPERGDLFSLAAIKVSVDGALGSRGALLSAPYSDRPETRGLETFSFERLEAIAKRARQRQFQVRVHAIGDLANTRVLDAFERAFGGSPKPALRWAIEHAQVVKPADIRRFARLGVIASMQATHATSDGPWAEERLGPERVSWSNAWRQFLNAGVRVTNGSDFPVESVSPLLGLYAAITRHDLHGRLPATGWRPEERMSAEEALRSFTREGAYAAFREKDLGTLELGKIADFTIIDRDPITGPAADIPRARVERTVVAGKTVFPPTASKP